jgi:hypothetical protein
MVVLIAMITLTLLAVPAGATLQYYTSPSAWAAATSGVFTTVDFNGYGLAYAPYYTDYSTGGGLTLGGVNFLGYGGEQYFLQVDNPAADSGNWNSGDYLRGGYSPGYIVATLPGTGALAVAFELMSFPNGKTISVTPSSGDPYNLPTSARPNRTFLGLVSDTPITSVRFSAPGGYTLLDNFQYEQIPEGSTLLLGGLGLAALWVGRRLRRYR